MSTNSTATTGTKMGPPATPAHRSRAAVRPATPSHGAQSHQTSSTTAAAPGQRTMDAATEARLLAHDREEQLSRRLQTHERNLLAWVSVMGAIAIWRRAQTDVQTAADVARQEIDDETAPPPPANVR